MKKIRSGILLALFLVCSPLFALDGDNTTICNRIVYDTEFDTFLNLREFFKANADFVTNFNPESEAYCTDLKQKFMTFPKKFYNGIEEGNIYENCMELDEKQLSFELESLKRIKYVINRCKL